MARMHHQFMSHDPARDGNVAFLRVELETGMTFVRVAETATDPDKIKRNFSNAKKAYLTVCRFINQSDSGPESAKLHKKLKQLERRLQALESRVATS